MKWQDFKIDKRFMQQLTLSIIICFILAPFITYSFIHSFNINNIFMTGILVMSCMPTTLSSGIVISELAGGNKHLSMLLTIGLNAAGIIAIPFILPFLLNNQNNIPINAGHLFFGLLTKVLTPFLVGNLVAKLNSSFRKYSWVSHLPSTCVILTVWITFSCQQQLLSSLSLKKLTLISSACLVIHLLLFILSFIMSQKLNYSRQDTLSLSFMNSQKTLPVAISIIASLTLESGGLLISCLLFHFIQLLCDSLLASKLKPKSI